MFMSNMAVSLLTTPSSPFYKMFLVPPTSALLIMKWESVCVCACGLCAMCVLYILMWHTVHVITRSVWLSQHTFVCLPEGLHVLCYLHNHTLCALGMMEILHTYNHTPGLYAGGGGIRGV